MRYIKDLYEGENIREIYYCKQTASLVAKTGKTYYALVLSDKTGTLDGKVWNITNGIEHYETGDFIRVDGQLTSFQNKPQLNITRIVKAQEGEYDPADYLPSSKYDIETMYAELLKLASSVSEPHLHALLEQLFVKDKSFIADFKRHSAAKSVHHGFIGGLLEHTLSVTKLCSGFAAQYELLNRDLLITAALCHDIGKVYELSSFPENDYTDEGNLLGHIVMGVEMIGERIRSIEGFPKLLETELKHCIVAHHGKLEFGSPKVPALSEAMALHFADNLDAKMQSMKELLEGVDDKATWLGWQKNFESNVRRT
ncbi:MAG: HD domain-containing protein [Lachnospiraceae bacterium]|nr:HD domain-containing protein [Lachnospiraceae bacterium]